MRSLALFVGLLLCVPAYAQDGADEDEQHQSEGDTESKDGPESEDEQAEKPVEPKSEDEKAKDEYPSVARWFAFVETLREDKTLTTRDFVNRSREVAEATLWRVVGTIRDITEDEKGNVYVSATYSRDGSSPNNVRLKWTSAKAKPVDGWVKGDTVAWVEQVIVRQDGATSWSWVTDDDKSQPRGAWFKKAKPKKPEPPPKPIVTKSARALEAWLKLYGARVLRRDWGNAWKSVSRNRETVWKIEGTIAGKVVRRSFVNVKPGGRMLVAIRHPGQRTYYIGEKRDVIPFNLPTGAPEFKTGDTVELLVRLQPAATRIELERARGDFEFSYELIWDDDE